MPYIDPAQREEILFERSAETPGELAFVLYSDIMDYIKPLDMSFLLLNEVVGVLENVKMEFVRRYVAPYEDHKREENGDV